MGNCVRTAGMFEGAKSFNQSLSAWDIAKVDNMQSMFKNATAFNQPLRKDWNVKHVSYGTDDMFENSGVAPAKRCLIM